MCGRFTLKSPASGLIEHFGIGPLARQLDFFVPRFNIAPTQDIAVVRIASFGEREVVMMRWGLIPSWTKEPSRGSPLINARSETVAEKPSFRAAYRRRRALVPADGFFEWKADGGRKQPYYIRRQDEGFLAFAAIWEEWDGTATGTGSHVQSCALLTTSANRLMSDLHDRMPVMIRPADYALWLDPEVQDAKKLAQLLAPLEDLLLQADPVSGHVNRPVNDDVRCIASLTPDG